jgi:FKBP-type peptidyl-prolyl cis-trans isomerase
MANLSRNEQIAVWVSVAVVVIFFLMFGFMSSQVRDVTDSNIIGTENENLMTGENNLQIETVLPGEGEEARPGDLLTVHYVGKLADGTVFDSSLQRGQPFQFVLGAGQVIAGWDQGVLGMREGGVRVLTIPPELAYGPQGQRPIPPNATLTFEVQLVAVESGAESAE